MTRRNLEISLAVSCTLTLTETECRALDALVGYGDDAFIKQFKEQLGTHYLRDHESGLRSFFKAVREQALPAIYEVDQVRKKLLHAYKVEQAMRQKALPATISPQDEQQLTTGVTQRQ